MGLGREQHAYILHTVCVLLLLLLLSCCYGANRDPLMFPSFIHTQKRNPQTHLKDPDMFWDFISLRPETTHQVTLYSHFHTIIYTFSHHYIHIFTPLYTHFHTIIFTFSHLHRSRSCSQTEGFPGGTDT